MNITKRHITINQYEYQLLMKSFHFITCNPDITNDRIPFVYLMFWTVDCFQETPNKKGSDAQEFVFEYIMKRSLRASPHLKPLFNSYSFGWLFHYFQIILITTYYAQKNNISIPPIRLFDLNEYAVPNLSNPEHLLAEYQHICKKEKII